MASRVVHLIPHTHWDREWYLPAGGHRGRLALAVEQLLRLADGDPRFTRFLLDGQTVLLEDLFAVRPDLRDRITQLVRSGRLDTGPWYVLADEQIPAGESLLRNLQLGREDAGALGRSCGTLYSPDAFGHPAILPALGHEFGLTRAVLWRGLGADATGGRDLCWWEAPDGRRTLVYHLPPDGYEIGSNLLVAAEQLSVAWRRVAAAVLPRAATGQVAVFVGADHHAPAPDLGGLADRLSAVDPDCRFRFSSVDEFLEAAAAEAGDLSVVRGELRWSYGYTWTLQGVHGTRAPLKRRNSMLELRLTRTVEPLLAVAGVSPARRAVLRRTWRDMVQSHFHDALGGCSQDAVARAMATRFDDAEAAAGDLVRDAQHALAGHDPDRVREGAPASPRLLVWNGAARPRGGVVVAEATFFRSDIPVGPPSGRASRKGAGFAPFALRAVAGPDGHVVVPQVLAVEPSLERRDAARHYPDQDLVDRVWFAFPMPHALPGLGSRLFETVSVPGEPLEAFVAARRRTLWNGRLTATVEPAGTVRLEDPARGVEFSGLLVLESERDEGDSYSFAPLRGDKPRRPARAGRAGITAEGPLVAGIEWSQSLACGNGPDGGAGRVTASFALLLIGDSPVLRCRIGLDNQALDHRLRLRLPLGLRGVAALAGAQFGSVARPPVIIKGRYPAERPVTTAPAHRWVAAAKGKRGLALLAPGFFEYEWTRGGDLLLTLLRCVGELSRADLATRPGHAGWPMPVPLAQCQGEDALDLGLALVTEDDLAAPERLEQLWEDCFVPPVACWIRDCATDRPLPQAPAISLEGEGLVFSAALPDDGGGIALRCFNQRSTPVAGRWRAALPLVRAERIRADGTLLGQLAPGDAGHAVSFTAGPHELVTVRLVLAVPPATDS